MNARPGQRLSEVLNLDAISATEIRPFDPSQPVSEAELRSLLHRSRVVRTLPPLEDPWSYSPWFSGSFCIEGVRYAFDCYLGRRCRIVSPSGEAITTDHD